MSSRPSTLVLDEEDDWGSITPLLASTRSSSQPPSTTSAGSGEFNAFSLVGSTLTGGGSKKFLWVFPEDKPLCLGKVGTSKFCVKEKGECGTCGTARHSSKFTIDAEGAYIHSTDNQIHCSPVLPVDAFSPTQRAKLLSVSFTVNDWEKIFMDIKSGVLPDWLAEREAEESAAAAEPAISLLSPSNSNNKQGIYDILPSFSQDSASSEERAELDSDMRIEKVKGQLKSLRSKLTRPFLDIEVSYTLIMTDLKTVHSRVEQCATSLGIDKGLVPVWKGIQEHSSKINFLESSISQMKSFAS
jgi:hypothetical protein